MKFSDLVLPVLSLSICLIYYYITLCCCTFSFENSDNRLAISIMYTVPIALCLHALFLILFHVTITVTVTVYSFLVPIIIISFFFLSSPFRFGVYVYRDVSMVYVFIGIVSRGKIEIPFKSNCVYIFSNGCNVLLKQFLCHPLTTIMALSSQMLPTK